MAAVSDAETRLLCYFAQLPKPMRRHILFADGQRRLDRLGEEPPTQLPDVLRTLRDVSFAHRTLAAAARTAPLRVAFTVEALPRVRAAVRAAPQGHEGAGVWLARRRAIAAGLESLKARKVVALHVAASQAAAPEYSSVWQGLRRHCSEAPGQAFTSLQVLDIGPNLPTEFASAAALAVDLPALHTLSFAPLPAGAFAGGPRRRLDLELLPPRVRHLTLHRVCASRHILQPAPPPARRLDSLTLRGTEQRPSLEPPVEADLVSLLRAARKVRLVAPQLRIVPAVTSAGVPGAAGAEPPGMHLPPGAAGPHGPPSLVGGEPPLAPPEVVQRVVHTLLWQFWASGVERLEMTFDGIDFTVEQVLFRSTPAAMEAAIRQLAEQPAYSADVASAPGAPTTALVRLVPGRARAAGGAAPTGEAAVAGGTAPARVAAPAGAAAVAAAGQGQMLAQQGGDSGVWVVVAAGAAAAAAAAVGWWLVFRRKPRRPSAGKEA
eukprot:scaffold8.g1656.t1